MEMQASRSEKIAFIFPAKFAPDGFAVNPELNFLEENGSAKLSVGISLLGLNKESYYWLTVTVTDPEENIVFQPPTERITPSDIDPVHCTTFISMNVFLQAKPLGVYQINCAISQYDGTAVYDSKYANFNIVGDN